MASKKELKPDKSIPPQTDVAPEQEGMNINPEFSENSEVSHSGTENEQITDFSEESIEEKTLKSAHSNTDEASFTQTDTEIMDSESIDMFADETITSSRELQQTDSEKTNLSGNLAGKHSKNSNNSIISIDENLTVETQEDKAKNDLLDLLESQKTGRILSGTIQGIEKTNDNPNRSLAVICHGDFKVIIPAEQAVEPPDDYRGRVPEDVMHYLMTKRLGAEIDYIVKGIDVESGIAVASRLEAMRAKRKQYYFGTDRNGNNLIYPDVCIEARVVSVIRAGIFVDLLGLEVYIPLRELSYQRLMDAAGYFQPGQRILVKVLEIDRSDNAHIKVSASVKQASENPYEKALRKYSTGNRYVGTVSMVDTNGVFVALDGGIDCLCSYPKRGRPPRGARVTVRILGINYEANRIWGAITHIAAAR